MATPNARCYPAASAVVLAAPKAKTSRVHDADSCARIEPNALPACAVVFARLDIKVGT